MGGGIRARLLSCRLTPSGRGTPSTSRSWFARAVNRLSPDFLEAVVAWHLSAFRAAASRVLTVRRAAARGSSLLIQGHSK